MDAPPRRTYEEGPFDPPSADARSFVLVGALVFLVSLGVFLIGIQAAGQIYFDETWYVPTARAFLKSGEMMHQEHPPLGKLLISLSLYLFGDNPLGWRALSAMFGALTVAAVWLWAYALLRSLSQAVWTAAVTLVDGVVFVQARIAMLDIFLMAFSMFALAFFTFGMKERNPRVRPVWALAMGVCLGLAGACKWSGFFLGFGLLGLVALIGLMRVWRVRFEDPRPNDFYAPEQARGWGPATMLTAFVAAPFFAYFVSYIPQIIHESTIFEFVASHERMWDIMSGHSADHPYSSLWYTWPALWRPVWYLFDVPGHDASLWTADNPAAAVVGLANPFVVWTGEIAILVSAWRWLFRRELEAAIVVVAFFAQYLPWILNPKGLEFSYYFFPSALTLGPALALGFFKGGGRPRWRAALAYLAVAAACFVFFLPVLAAGIGVTPESFALRIWLPSWR